jgi:23S rRNA (adenine-N6)-dimethyltransferase
MPQNRKKGTTPPIWVSQNFLTSYKIINRIIRRTTLNKKDHVIEIGPGKGHIRFLDKKMPESFGN